MSELQRARVMRPDRPMAQRALASVDGVFSGEEAWERLEARGLLPSGTVGADSRAFGAWATSYDSWRTLHFTDDEPAGNAFPKRRALREAMPPTVGLAAALASDWSGVLTAEAIAREAFEALRPWVRPAVLRTPPVCWRVGLGASDGERGDLWYARARALVYGGRELEEVGEIRAELVSRPLRVIGELTALEDAHCAWLFESARAELAREREQRDQQALDRGYPAPGPSAPTLAERWPWYPANMQPSLAVASRFNQRFGRDIPSMIDAPNPFAPLVALWNTGYAPVSFTSTLIVLEAAPLTLS